MIIASVATSAAISAMTSFRMCGVAHQPAVQPHQRQFEAQPDHRADKDRRQYQERAEDHLEYHGAIITGTGRAVNRWTSPRRATYLGRVMASPKENPELQGDRREQAGAVRIYAIESDLEAGIQLEGSEVKSLRVNAANIAESYAEVDNGELWLVNNSIAPYDPGRTFGHEERRRRKLLVSKKQLSELWNATQRKGMTSSRWSSTSIIAACEAEDRSRPRQEALRQARDGGQARLEPPEGAASEGTRRSTATNPAPSLRRWTRPVLSSDQFPIRASFA